MTRISNRVGTRVPPRVTIRAETGIHRRIPIGRKPPTARRRVASIPHETLTIRQ